MGIAPLPRDPIRNASQMEPSIVPTEPDYLSGRRHWPPMASDDYKQTVRASNGARGGQTTSVRATRAARRHAYTRVATRQHSTADHLTQQQRHPTPQGHSQPRRPRPGTLHGCHTRPPSDQGQRSTHIQPNGHRVLAAAGWGALLRWPCRAPPRGASPA